MLLKQLIQLPTTSSKLFVCDPFQMPGKDELVKQVIGLANAKVDGPRHILFGINAGAMEGSKIVGLDENSISILKKAHRQISELIVPTVSLAFIYDSFDGKLVGALEIDDCDAGPFAVGQDYSNELSRGKSWIWENRQLREVSVSNLARVTAPEPTEVIDEAYLAHPVAVPTIDVGFNDDPDRKFIELPIPDTSDPPFDPETQHARGLGQTIRETVNTLTNRVLNPAAWSAGDADPDLSTDVFKAAQDLQIDANNHYFFEEKAVKINFAICNRGARGIEDLRIELGFPKVKDFDVVDRIYTSPFDKRTAAITKKATYPKIRRVDGGIFVLRRIRALEPSSTIPALKSALRLAVGPAMQNKKVAILYTLRRQDEVIGEGRLKIRFGKITR